MSVPDLTNDPLWHAYERASNAYRASMQMRLRLDAELSTTFSEETLRAWDAAHREEEKCFEELKSAERAVRAKYANI
jgi:hypothetical protein